MIAYIGCFIDQTELLGEMLKYNQSSQHLAHLIDYPHVTLAYAPDNCYKELFGEKVKIEVYSYGNDKRNEGLGVRVKTNNIIIAKMVNCVKAPHITVSIADGARPVDTSDLKFVEIKPFELTGLFGGFELRNKKPIVC